MEVHKKMAKTAIKEEINELQGLYDKEILKSIESLPTEDDLPYDDGEPMDTPRHREQMNILIETIQDYWKGSRKFYVGGNMFLHYHPYNLSKFKGPDFFLVLDAEERERKSWVVWQEGMRFPDVIIELLSNKTRKIDKVDKKELYSRVFKTGEYFLYDPYAQEFEGFRLHGNHYKPLLPDKEKKIYSEITGLYLIVKNDWLRWMTKEGYILPTRLEMVEQEKQRTEKAEQLLEEYRRRIDDL